MVHLSRHDVGHKADGKLRCTGILPSEKFIAKLKKHQMR